MRILGLVVSALLTLAVAGCGSDDADGAAPSRDATTATASPTDDSMDMGHSDMDGMDDGASDEDAVASTLTDAEKIAVRLEQIFAASSYPRDLAGAVKVAQSNGLDPSSGNTIAGYTYDAADVEFKLCVENTGGAYAVYDTRPMSMRASGKSGGCP